MDVDSIASVFCELNVLECWLWSLTSQESYWLVLVPRFELDRLAGDRPNQFLLIFLHLLTSLLYTSYTSLHLFTFVSLPHFLLTGVVACCLWFQTEGLSFPHGNCLFQASLLYIFRNDLVIVGEGRAVSAMQSFAKTLVHTGHVQYDEATCFWCDTQRTSRVVKCYGCFQCFQCFHITLNKSDFTSAVASFTLDLFVVQVYILSILLSFACPRAKHVTEMHGWTW